MSNLRQRTSSSVQQPATSSDSDSDVDPQPPQPPPQTAVSQTLASTAYLANLLPSGTLLAFQILTPIFTNNGQCDAATRPLTIILLFILAASCFLASFTDSFKSSNGNVSYGFATWKGMWLFDETNSDTGNEHDLSKYRIRVIDWVHALLSMVVFCTVALRDRNVASCLCPRPSQETREVLDIVPIGVGLLCGLLFVLFPTKRHGIGYPVTKAN